MRQNVIFFCWAFTIHYLSGQNPTTTSNSYIAAEFTLGKIMEANDGFPSTNLQGEFFLSYGSYNNYNASEWVQQLNYPKTGVMLGFSDFGNTQNVGKAYAIMPFIELTPFKKTHINVGFGSSYIDTQYDSISNPNNRGASTKVNWSFRSFLYYDIIKTKAIDWRFGMGYAHHSNGHTRLPNQGLNSFLGSISAKINTKKSPTVFSEVRKTKSRQTYFSSRFGYGINVLSQRFNTLKPVYTIALEYGKIYNETFQLGYGFYYRFYEHYYDYIKNNGALIVEDYPIFQDNPFGYASNFGLFVTTEVLLGHVGVSLDIGINIYKPFYKVDWRLTQGYEYTNAQGQTFEVLGELDWYYEIKRTISSRLGLKYYLVNTDKTPKHNIFFGVHINANLGQADFTDFSLGYVYRFAKKSK
ncbi:MAG: acyloxyacyl hydrolase [Flavobacteriaceae bacterium]|nr:acyloxyacyl hydrolase [Flavobacteriaceae bacterium]